MADTHLRGQTLDDLMRSAIQEILSNGERIKPTKGWCTEVTGVLLELTNPLARVSRTETRGKPFSSLGELCWYMAKTNDLGFIEYYIPEYKKSSEQGLIYGGYGPRLFDWNGINQIGNITSRLRKKPNSRKAVIQLFEASDIAASHKDTPCTCTLQFLQRGAKLNMIIYMRSNDAYLGLPHDIFCFTMLQEIVARDLNVGLGTYKHMVGSLHLYDDRKEAAQRFLAEGFQSTEMSMPAMPTGNPWPAIKLLLKAEVAIRTGNAIDDGELKDLAPYWRDLIRLLQIFRAWKKDKDLNKIKEWREKMSTNLFHTFIDMKINDLVN
jgi:thymidylate synthase